ncbi:MAG: M56 family metallopeptidase [Actinobacteria bacterium]|nr:M56 family metallopeptidase [Actinomycetota bacterium]
MMRAAIVTVLLVYAMSAALAGAHWLPQATWAPRAPRAAIATWQAATLSIVASVLAAGVILAVPCLPCSLTPAAFHTCLMAMWAQHWMPEGILTTGFGALLVVTVLGRIAWCLGAALAGAHRRRVRHDEVLTVIARPGPDGVQVIDDDQPAVYCLPGRRRIVLTTGALRCLKGRQLEAVVAHERAHLAGRHHLLVAFAGALQHAFPVVPFFALAATQVGDLVEVAADDVATRRENRLTLAGALLAVAAAGAPAGALGAGGTAAAERIRRLIEPPGRPSRGQWALTSLTLATVSMLSVGAPAVALLTILHCP